MLNRFFIKEYSVHWPKFNGQDHDHSGSSSRSSGVSEKSRINQMSLKSREGSPTQHENIKSGENLISPKKTADKPANIIEEVFTDQATIHHSNSRSPSYMKKSATMSNGPAPRHRTMLGRTSVSKSFQN